MTLNISKPKVDSPYARVGADLVDMGYSAIPIMPGSKRPGSISFGKWYGDMEWQRYCDRLPTEIETSIWSRWPDAGVCVAIDHTLKVIDIDTDDLELREAIEAVLPETMVKKKGRKGYSAFFRGSENIVNRPYNLILAGGFETRVIDLLCHGRQTVLPPTIHPDSGEPYGWITEDTLMDTPIEKLPLLPDDIAERLVEALKPFGTVQEHKTRSSSGEDVFGESIWREVNSFALANLDSWVPQLFGTDAKRSRDGTYRARAFWRGVDNQNVGIHPDGITDWGAGRSYTPIDLVMAAHGTGYFEPAYEWLVKQTGYAPAEDEWMARAAENAKRILRSSKLKREEAERKIAAAAEAPVAVAELPPVRAPRARLDPFTPQAAGGLIGAIAQWSLDTARRPVQEFAVLSALSFVATIFGRQAVGPTGAGLNLYLVGIAGPGFGKEHAFKTLQTIALDSGQQNLIGPGEVTAGSAIEKVARRRPVFVMPWDEMGVVLQSVTGAGSSSWAKTIRKVLLEIFSKSTSVWSGKEHADPSTDSSADPIYCPTVSLLGMSTPITFYKGLTEETLSDGFVARLIVVEAKDRPDRHAAPPLMVTPASLSTAVKEAQKALPVAPVAKVNWSNSKMRPHLYTVPWEDEAAEKRWLAIEDWQYEQIEEHGAHDGLIGRTAEHVVKLATVRALSRQPELPSVSLEDIEWAYAVVQRSIDCLESGAKEHMAGSQFEELCKAILRELKRAGGEIAQSVLVRKKGVSKADDRMVKAALDRLVVAGEIYQPEAIARGVKIRLKSHEGEAA
ncbi:bifunctional DNA primase/polymerase [Rhizobium leucaenae]|uniref:bifunctional DNA primase/polymerase n=1 Tax=Rhizobium leucaenae TaxID=29450 RepID=UPI0007EE72A1|nr:bifunctional DNA primase/polymerase [Rhizobium leucaenae]